MIIISVICSRKTLSSFRVALVLPRPLLRDVLTVRAEWNCDSLVSARVYFDLISVLVAAC